MNPRQLHRYVNLQGAAYVVRGLPLRLLGSPLYSTI